VLEAPPVEISGGRFALMGNGLADLPPAAAVRDYLLARGARLVTVFHPLGSEEQGRHELVRYDGTGRARRRVLTLPSRPPMTYPLDLVVPPTFPIVDGWIGFNNLASLRGLAARRRRRARRVVYWAVDFVPGRFRSGPLTSMFDRVDARCCGAVDARIEVSRAALEGRNRRLDLTGRAASATVCPNGIWLDRLATVRTDAWRDRRVVFIGHLVERMGAETIVESLRILRDRSINVSADIAGHGPLELQLRNHAASVGLGETIRFNGFIAEHERLERLVATASVALAPYSTRVGSYTQFTDPLKLKSYIGAGLPTLLTDAPPNAVELQHSAGAEIVADDPTAFADAIARLLDDPEEWQRRHAAALKYARRFDWTALLDRALGSAGFVP
jgi:glycosyltransferase involved in cell wall biosynthesis